ncbi:reverse transcriptase domain-containing protein, partial [Tanacetum coccineum]
MATTTMIQGLFEKIESIFSISNYTEACQVKFATCTLQGNALTWWNSHVKTVTPEAAHAMPWRTLKKMTTYKYCLRGEIKKFEFEMWNLKVKGTDVVTYNQRFQELALMCDRMFPEEANKIEKRSALLLNDKLRTRGNLMTTTKLNNNFPRGRMWLKLTLLGLVKGRNMLELYHYATSANFTTMARALTLTCYGCGNQGNYKSDYPELKNQNHGNQAEGTKARGMLYALGGGETDQDPNNIEDGIE